MLIINRIRMALAIGVLCGQPFSSATAEEQAARAAEPAAPAVEPAAQAPQRTNPLGVKPVDLSALSAKRGGSSTVNDVKLRGVVADNKAIDVVTGNNVIADGAFTNAAGMPMVIQNSGNNVLIQSSTVVNLRLQ